MSIRNKTLNTALAYIAITDSKRCLHIDTRIAVLEYVKTNTDWQPGARSYIVNDAGMALARKSKLWRAHERLTEMGFKPDATRKTKPRFIPYTDIAPVNTKYGPRVPVAFTGKHGDVYAERLNDEARLVMERI
jgi:hypothetical protein